MPSKMGKTSKTSQTGAKQAVGGASKTAAKKAATPKDAVRKPAASKKAAKASGASAAKAGLAAKTKTNAKAKTKVKTKPRTKGTPAIAKTTAVGVTARRATAGRPARLSREKVLAASMELLEQGPVEQFTLAKLAKSLDTVSMALYNYFPSRDALLEAIGDHICMQFEMPPAKRDQRWQDTLMQWLWTFKAHAERYPIVLKVMGVNGNSSPGWLRITLTVSRTLYAQGFRGHDLALHVWLFCSYAVAVVFNELQGGHFRSGISLSHIDRLEPDEQEFLLMLRKHNMTLTTDEVLELAFQQMIGNLEREVARIQGV
jgi:AcrR family transcriptional regulator